MRPPSFFSKRKQSTTSRNRTVNAKNVQNVKNFLNSYRGNNDISKRDLKKMVKLLNISKQNKLMYTTLINHSYQRNEVYGELLKLFLKEKHMLPKFKEIRRLTQKLRGILNRNDLAVYERNAFVNSLQKLHTYTNNELQKTNSMINAIRYTKEQQAKTASMTGKTINLT